MDGEDRRPIQSVLVIDDDPDLRALTQMQLADRFDVLQAASGEEGIDLAARRAPDVILLDMIMPGMEGMDALDRLVSDPITRDIPVIFVSAMSTVHDRVHALEAGAVDFITRPADPREFAARVEAAARLHARHQELRKLASGDDVTGLPGREAFELRLEQEVARSKRGGNPLSIIFVDVDAMRHVNELHGRSTGNAVLRAVGDSLRASLRTSDILYRYDGDAFAVILPDADAGAAGIAAERARRALDSVRSEVPITVSVGISELSSGRGTEELVHAAQQALERAQTSGGDRVWRADDPRRRALDTRNLAIDLTERELAVLTHLADRQTEQDIARRMGIRPGTVRSHKARIRRKLHVAPDVRLSQFVRDHYDELMPQGSIDLRDAGRPRS